MLNVVAISMRYKLSLLHCWCKCVKWF